LNFDQNLIDSSKSIGANSGIHTYDQPETENEYDTKIPDEMVSPKFESQNID